MELPTQTRKVLQNTIVYTVQKACEKYASVSGKALPLPVQKFLIVMLSDIIDLILDSATHGKVLSPKDAAIFALKRANNVAALGLETAGSQKLLECGVAIAALAFTTMETIELEQVCGAAMATGVGSPAAAVVAVSGALYWAYQVMDTIQTCNSVSFPPSTEQIEAKFPPADNISGERATYTHYAENVCRVGKEDPQMNF